MRTAGRDHRAALRRAAALPTDGRYPLGTDSAERRKRRTLDALFGWLVAQVRHGPMLLIVEDLQWVDLTTLELLSRYFGSEPVGR